MYFPRVHRGAIKVIAAVFLLCCVHDSQAGLVINFLNSTNNASADAGFQLAANYIQSQFNDNVTINVNRGFAALGPGVLGQAGSSSLSFSYATWRAAVQSDILGSSDATFAASLPNGPSFSAYMNRTSQNGNSAAPYVATNLTNVEISTANAKALGLSNFGGTDATITFSSAFTWDFDNSDGITAGAQDFVGVATHELMHAMGFISGVDDIDSSPGSSQSSYAPTGLDFARHSAASFSNNADLDLTADTRVKFFSLTGDLTALPLEASGSFSTGVTFGDGRQASHWKDGLGIGIMDPTSNPAGQLNVVSNLDLQALDIIGWNVTAVPEPGSMALIGLTSIGLLFVRRRKL